MLEVCCGSYEDAYAAYAGGAKRIELNCALHLGGLTPTIGCLQLVKKETDLKVICMVRSRGAGFHYSEKEYQQMFLEAKLLLENGADGLAFGFLHGNGTIHRERTKEMVTLVHSYNKEAVFHRAFDCTKDAFQSMELLIQCQVDRVLTSGLEAQAMKGRNCLKALQEQYGQQIEIVAGSGITVDNAKELMEHTGISQIHSSCKDWKYDSTTTTRVSYSYGSGTHVDDYDCVSEVLVRKLLESII